MAIASFREKNCATLILKINCIKITRIRAFRKFFLDFAAKKKTLLTYVVCRC